MGSQDTQRQGHAQQDENGLENIPQGNHQVRHGALYLGDLQEKIAVKPEIEGRGQYGQGRTDGRQRYGKLDIGLGQRTDEIGDVAARAGGHQDHAQGHRPGYPAEFPHQQGQQEGQQRQEDQLAAHADDHGLGFLENFDENVGFDTQGDTVHHKCEDDVDGVHATRIQGDINAVDRGSNFGFHTISKRGLKPVPLSFRERGRPWPMNGRGPSLLGRGEQPWLRR